jgi:hypothetical protein
MFDNDHINKLVDDTLNSMDHHERAAPRPFLLSRINARILKRGESTMWDRLTSIITRPVIAFGGLVLVIMLNILIISFNKDAAVYNGIQEDEIADGQGFSIATTTALYDIENIEP